MNKIVCVLLLATLGLAGCKSRHMVVASTGTVIGVEVSQNPASQLYQAKLGYNRAELAVVPTNRKANDSDGEENYNGGATDVPDVLMEMRYTGIFKGGESSGIYQRLAVGSTAVQQPGASMMFAKGNDGKVDPKTAAALQSLQSIPAVDVDIVVEKAKISNFRKSASPEQKTIITDEVKKLGYTSWDNFSIGNPQEVTPEQINQLKNALKAKGIEIQ